MSGPRYTKLASGLPASVPFVGPEAQERATGQKFVARIGANENVFGPSPCAIAAMEKAASEVWMYADPESHDLRNALAVHHGIDPDNIMIGEGIDALLGYLVRLLVEPGDRVVTSAGAYPTFNFHVAGFGGYLATVPYRDDAEDPHALIHAAKENDAKLVYLANPDNPMGSFHDASVINDMMKELPTGCVLVLDEAYVEFAPKSAVPEITTIRDNVIRMRTFSKAYGMAGARVGYAIGAPELICAFNKIRNHFGMSRISQSGALSALQDQEYLEETIKRVARARERIVRIAENNGLTALPSATNFVAIDCGQNGDFARAVLTELTDAFGIFVRMPFVAPQDRCIRVTAGTDEDLDAFEAAFPKALAKARRKQGCD